MLRLRAERELGRLLRGDYGNKEVWNELLTTPGGFEEFQRMGDARIAELEAAP